MHEKGILRRADPCREGAEKADALHGGPRDAVHHRVQAAGHQEYGLVYEAGRLDAPGRPALFATTEEFLRRFGVDSRKDLPTVTPDQEAEIAQEVEKEVKYRFGLETSETEARENDAAENREEGQQEAAEGQEKAPEEN